MDLVKAIIFDLEGTLVQSSTRFSRMKSMMIKFLSNHGVDRNLISAQQSTITIIERATDSLRKGGMSESKIKTILRQLGEIMDKSELEGVNEVKPIKGAKDTLEKLSSRDIKIGILTRCCKAYAVEALKRCGMISLVDFIEARSDLLEAKPNAVSAWRLCKMLGVEPDEAVIVGDHWIDVECANSAGIDFIGVLSGLSDKDTLEKAGCKTFAKNITKIEDMLNLTR